MFVDIAVCHAREPASGSPSVSYVCTSRVPPATSIIARGQRLYCTSDVWAPANNAGCHLSLPPSSRTRHGFLFHTLSHTTSRRVYQISVMVAFDRSPCDILSTAFLTHSLTLPHRSLPFHPPFRDLFTSTHSSHLRSSFLPAIPSIPHPSLVSSKVHSLPQHTHLVQKVKYNDFSKIRTQ